MPSTARLLSSALVIEPAKVSTPRSTSQSGIDVAITRTSLAPSSMSCRTRCEPRKPVPPVISVTARCRFSIAARRLVPVVVMRAVRLVEVLEGMISVRSYPQITQIKTNLCNLRMDLDHSLLGHRREFFLSLALPVPAQALRIERRARAVAKVYDLMPDASGNQPVGLGAWHSRSHFFQFFDLEETSDASADVAALNERCSFGHCFISAFEEHRQDAHARV